MNQFPPYPRVFQFRPFRIFSKIHGDIRDSRCTTGINDTAGKFATGVNDTGGKIAAGINDTGGKFPPVSATPAANFYTIFACVVDTGGKLPPASTTPAANLPPVSLTPVANNGNNIRLQTP
jgi:hypothetical protein